MSCERRFEEELHRRGLRVTPQREVILSALHSFHSPFTAEEVYQRVIASSPGLKLSTVYRTLELLSSINLVSVVDVGNRGRHYVHLEEGTPHFHLVCRSCGKTVGVSPQEMAGFQTEIQRVHRFDIDVSGVSLAGVCEQCRKDRE